MSKRELKNTAWKQIIFFERICLKDRISKERFWADMTNLSWKDEKHPACSN